MFTAVHRLFATANFAFAFGNLELTLEDILGPGTSVIHPARYGEVCFLYNLPDDGRGWRELGDGGWDANGTSGSLDDAARSADEDFSLTTSNLGFTLGNVTFTLGKGLRPLGSDVSPNAFVHGRLRIWNDVSWWGWGSGGGVLRGEREHYGKDGEN